MRILITGSKGQVGWELVRQAPDHGFDILAVDVDELDITDSEDVDKTIINSDIALVINAAAYTAVDRAESEPKAAFAVNREGPANLASACSNAGIPLIHISTDYVFDGTKKGAYLESDPVSPLGVYGQSKAAGEDEVRKRLHEHIILRTAWVYGVHGHNFVKTILKLSREREEISIVDDQYGCPTSAADIAEVLLEIAVKILKEKRVIRGAYHYCGKGKTSWYRFAKAIIENAGKFESLKVKKINPINTDDYPTPAKRPVNSVLDCNLIAKSLSIRPKSWQDSLVEIIESHSLSMSSR